MSKDKTVLEEMHSDVSGFHGLLATAERPWLNMLDEATSIVKNFTHEVLSKFSQIDGEAAKQAYDAWLKGECLRLNDLYLGWVADEQIEGYTRGIWNTPAQLGHYISIARGSNSDQAHAVRDAFYSHAAEILDTATTHANDGIEDWGWKLEALMETLSNNLLGLKDEDGDFVVPDGLAPPPL